MALPDLTEHGYRVITPLGQGAEGVVYKAVYTGKTKKGVMEPNQAVAIKFTPAEKVRPNEVLLQARIQHINVIRLYDVFRMTDTLGHAFVAVVMEIADPSTYGLRGSSLWSCVEATVKENMNRIVYAREVGAKIRAPVIGGEPMIRWMFLQVASALDYLHRHPLGICNRDVKPENVLVVTFEPHADGVMRPVCKIADFGFSKANSTAQSNAFITRLGTAYYVAPEIFLLKADRSEGYDGSKADVWSAGILLYTLTSGLRPFQARPDDDDKIVMLRATQQKHVDLLFAQLSRVGASPELVDLLRGMLCIDPGGRLSMLEVINHPWSRKLNQDITAPVAQHAADGKGADAAVPTRALPCWDWLNASAERSVAAAQHAWEAAREKGVFAAHGWSLPYPYQDVKRMLDEVQDAGNASRAAAPAAGPPSGSTSADDSAP
eukprot:jgi/Ulvmu1/8885/UM049_0067.1